MNVKIKSKQKYSDIPNLLNQSASFLILSTNQHSSERNRCGIRAHLGLPMHSCRKAVHTTVLLFLIFRIMAKKELGSGAGKATDGAIGDGEPRLRHQKKRPKRCAIGCYHASAVILLIGIIVAIAGICSSRLFEIFLYDNRHPPLFHHISIHVGLFDVRGEITGNGANPETKELEYPPVLDG